MSAPNLKAFVLCENASDSTANGDRKDLAGVGLSRIEWTDPFPARVTFWAFGQLSDQKERGTVQLTLMRTDSGRRFYFRPVAIRHKDAVTATVFCIRVFDCVFPERGVYFLELWYDNEWLADQRLEVF